MKAILWLLLWIGSATDAHALAFDHYHAQDEINSYLRATAAAHPGLARFVSLGYSEQGREVNLVVLSKGDVENRPAIYLNGTHHGNEKSSTEAVLGLIDYIVNNADHPDVAPLLERYALFLQPLVNPDGHAANTRGDSHGRDPNRDYAYPEHEADAFHTPTAQLVKSLTDKVKFRAAAAFHSGMEAVLWPLGFSGTKPVDYDAFYTLAKLTAEAMRVPQYSQSYYDYPTRGEFIDYVYLTHGTLALTLEVSAEGNPPLPTLLTAVQRGVEGGLAFMHGILRLDEGSLEMRHVPDAPSTPPMTLVTLPERSTRSE